MTTEQRTILPPDAERPQFYAHGLFKPSPTQPRKTFLAERIQELADSIEAKGQLQPILARPNPTYTGENGEPPYEIVFGESRWRGVGLKPHLPGVLATIRELTDFEVIEIQIIENMARTDLHPYEEAEGMSKLLRAPDGLQGYANAEELAARLGKSRRWVYQRLSLLNLSEKAKTSLLDGTISLSIALLLARMTDSGQQDRALTRIASGWGGDPLSVRAASQMLRAEFMLDLSKASFALETTYQVAGPCGQCPKRSGSNPDLFSEITAGDMCQDFACYKAKSIEHREIGFTEAAAAGHRVLRGEEAAEFMPWHESPPEGYVNADEPCEELTDSERPLREHFGKKAPAEVVVEHEDVDRVVRLVSLEDAKKILKAKNLLRDATAQAAAATEAKPTPKPRARSAHELGYATKTLAAKKFGIQAGTLMRDGLRRLDSMPANVARILAFHALNELGYDSVRLVFALQGWPSPAGDDLDDPEYESVEASINRRLDELAANGEIGTLGEITLHAQFASTLTSLYGIGQIFEAEDSECLVRDLATVLGVMDRLKPIHEAAMAEAEQEISDEEDERLGRKKEPDATDAFVAAHAPASSPAPSKKITAKYRNAATNETWSGRGLQPKWLKAAIAGGAKLEEFEVTA